MRRFVVLCVASILLVVAGCAGAPSAVAPTPDSESRRELADGAVVGFVDGYGAHVWRGIPYAEPPIGALRWRAPLPPARREPTREALSAAPACTQMPSVFGGIEARDEDTPVGQEDCLYLNVFAPRFAVRAIPRGSERLPVMVWIHGGGNVVGHAGRYEGGNLAASEQVIVVTIHYRLGPFGWFRHGALRAGAESDDDRSGNYGTLDMVRALTWVRDNIDPFGGDPGNVTIFGESAGARDVFSLLLSPRARGLMQRAVVQSGGTATTPVAAAEAFTDATPPGEPNSSNEILLRVLAPGVPRAEAKRRVAALAPCDVASRLRALPAADLIRAYHRESQEGLIDVPQLFRDGVVLPASEPLEAVRAGRYNRIPTILGTNKDENKLFLAFNPEFTWRLFGVLPIVRDPARYDATARHLTQHWRARGVDEPATAMRPVQGPSVFAYRFDWDEEPKAFTVDVAQLVGAAHGFEIPFVFGHWDLGSQTKLLFSKGNAPGRLELARTMMAYWAAFARGGDPNGPRTTGLPRWEPFAVPEGRFLVLDTGADGGVRMATGNVTSDAALAAVEDDATLATPEAKCDVYRQFVRWAREPSAADYPKMAGGACARFPLPAT